MSEWSKDAINSRIQQHRFTDASVTFKKADGSLLSATEVTVEQTSHAFGFGAIGFELVEGWPGKKAWNSDQIAGYKERMLGIMNYATMPFYWKALNRKKGNQ